MASEGECIYREFDYDKETGYERWQRRAKAGSTKSVLAKFKAAWSGGYQQDISIMTRRLGMNAGKEDQGGFDEERSGQIQGSVVRRISATVAEIGKPQANKLVAHENSEEHPFLGACLAWRCTAMESLEVNLPTGGLAASQGFATSLSTAVLPLMIALPALELSNLEMFEYIDICVFDFAEHSLRVRGKPFEAEFQNMFEVTKEADDLAKRQGMLGTALVIIDIITSDGARGLVRGTPVVLSMKAIINEGLSIKEMFGAHKMAGTLPLPRRPEIYFGCIHIR
ncbi:hypothetical protein K438DRAFT_1751367 [Mycena galopus ATCC 62051]|nr:hypothetical protein K438DRAFT_1751367 [Mycena galopus ATCC 62051]